MQSRIVKWGVLGYMVCSLVAVVWLSLAIGSARSFRETALGSQATLLGNTLAGAAQNLNGVGAKSQDAERLLVNAEASLAQFEIVALGYKQITGNRLPISEVVGFYTAQISGVRQELGRGIPLTEESLKTLEDVRADLSVLREACQVDVLMHGSQAQVTRLFTDVAGDLRIRGARELIQGSTSP